MGFFLHMLWRMLLGMGVVIALIATLLVGATLYRFGQDTATYELLAQPDTTSLSRVYDRHGVRIGEFARMRRIYTPIADIPPLVIQAFLSAEDKNFYTHFGMDVLGIIRASWHNIRSIYTRERLQGASTITQQVAKKFMPDEARNFTRKLKEAVVALRLEERHDKDDILEYYLNTIYLGQGSYGVTAAAQDYFGKELSQLTLSDAAFLAALPKAPNNYHPTLHTQNALDRRNWVLTRMLKNGYITRMQALKAQRQALVERATSRTNPNDYRYFVEHIRRLVQNEYGERLYADGLHIHTTLDADLQKLAHQSLLAGVSAYDRRHGYRGPVVRLPGITSDSNSWATALQQVDMPYDMLPWRLAVILARQSGWLKIGLLQEGNIPQTGRIMASELRWALMDTKGQRLSVAERFAPGDVVWVAPLDAGEYALRQHPLANGAIVVLDMQDGSILAMSGGVNWQTSQFNRATQAQRQPGSAFKPFVYAAALEKGFTPASQFLDAPFVLPKGEQAGFWKPQNYDKGFFGMASLRMGLEASRNLMTIRVANRLGMQTVSQSARAFGIYETMPPVLAMALGAGETSLLRLTNAYSILGSGGQYREPVGIARIATRHNTILFDAAAPAQTNPPISEFGGLHPHAPYSVISAQSAYQITTMLEGVVQRGTARRLQALGYPLAGKTGTSNDMRDAWFVGYTPHLVVGCFVGFDTPQSLGEGESGAQVAIPIAEHFLRIALQEYPKDEFAVPDGIEFVQVHLQTGRPGQGAHSVREAFKHGKAPVKSDPIAIRQRAASQYVAPDFFELY